METCCRERYEVLKAPTSDLFIVFEVFDCCKGLPSARRTVRELNVAESVHVSRNPNTEAICSNDGEFADAPAALQA